MTTKAVIPAENDSGLNARLAEHFGRAPYFVIVDLENGKVTSVTTVPNTGEHVGGVGHPHEKLLALKPDVVIARGMGPRGLQSLHDACIKVLKTNAPTVKETVAAFQQGKLTELESGCEHAHHH
ncbi:MAG: NifB/NifX family molybdenum-iron cluster-binding protein [Candidatus Bathyarchaeia archaeon]